MDAKRTVIEPVEARQLFSTAPALLTPPTPVYDAPVIVMHGYGYAPAAMQTIYLAPAGGMTSAPPAMATASPATAVPAAPALAASVATPAPPATANTINNTVASPPSAVHASIESSDSATPSFTAPTPASVAANGMPASAFIPVGPPRAVESSWASAANAAVSGWKELATLAASPFGGGESDAPPAWVAGFEHEFAATPLPQVAGAVAHVVEQGIAFVSAEAEPLLAAGLQHAAAVEALASLFAGGAFTAWWLDQREEDQPIATALSTAFCERFIGFGRA